MEDTNMPLESVKFWSGTVRPHNNNTKNQNSNSNNNNNKSFLKVHVKQGMLLHITGACIWDDINEGEDNNAVITTPGRAILQVIVSDNNNNNNGPSTAGTLCVLNDGGKYGNGPVNATLAAYFETDVQFRVIGNKSVHIYGHLVDARTDMPLDEEDEDAVRQQTSTTTTTNTIIAPINKNQKDEEHNSNNFNSINGHKRDRSDSSSSSSSDSGSSSSSSSSDAEDDDDDSQLKQQKKKQKLLKNNNNNKKQLLDDVSNALVNIIKVSPRKSVKLNDLGTLYKEATNNNLKHQTGTRLTKYLEEHSDIFTLNQRDQSVEIKNAHLYF